MYTQSELKQQVAQAAVDYVLPFLTPDSILGVGTGSTVDLFIDALAAHKHAFVHLRRVTENYGAHAVLLQVIAGHRDRVPLAGDQLFVDLALSDKNVPPGTHLEIGTALLEITAIPHLGCKKFVERFGLAAMKFANSDFGREHNLRGVNARVVRSGTFRTGGIVSIIGR